MPPPLSGNKVTKISSLKIPAIFAQNTPPPQPQIRKPIKKLPSMGNKLGTSDVNNNSDSENVKVKNGEGLGGYMSPKVGPNRRNSVNKVSDKIEGNGTVSDNLSNELTINGVASDKLPDLVASLPNGEHGIVNGSDLTGAFPKNGLKRIEDKVCSDTKAVVENSKTANEIEVVKSIKNNASNGQTSTAEMITEKSKIVSKTLENEKITVKNETSSTNSEEILKIVENDKSKTFVNNKTEISETVNVNSDHIENTEKNKIISNKNGIETKVKNKQINADIEITVSNEKAIETSSINSNIEKIAVGEILKNVENEKSKKFVNGKTEISQTVTVNSNHIENTDKIKTISNKNAIETKIENKQTNADIEKTVSNEKTTETSSMNSNVENIAEILKTVENDKSKAFVNGKTEINKTVTVNSDHIENTAQKAIETNIENKQIIADCEKTVLNKKTVTKNSDKYQTVEITNNVLSSNETGQTIAEKSETRIETDDSSKNILIDTNVKTIEAIAFVEKNENNQTITTKQNTKVVNTDNIKTSFPTVANSVENDQTIAEQCKSEVNHCQKIASIEKIDPKNGQIIAEVSSSKHQNGQISAEINKIEKTKKEKTKVASITEISQTTATNTAENGETIAAEYESEVKKCQKIAPGEKVEVTTISKSQNGQISGDANSEIKNSQRIASVEKTGTVTSKIKTQNGQTAADLNNEVKNVQKITSVEKTELTISSNTKTQNGQKVKNSQIIDLGEETETTISRTTKSQNGQISAKTNKIGAKTCENGNGFHTNGKNDRNVEENGPVTENQKDKVEMKNLVEETRRVSTKNGIALEENSKTFSKAKKIENGDVITAKAESVLRKNKFENGTSAKEQNKQLVQTRKTSLNKISKTDSIEQLLEKVDEEKSTKIINSKIIKSDILATPTNGFPKTKLVTTSSEKSIEKDAKINRRLSRDSTPNSLKLIAARSIQKAERKKNQETKKTEEEIKSEGKKVFTFNGVEIIDTPTDKLDLPTVLPKVGVNGTIEANSSNENSLELPTILPICKGARPKSSNSSNYCSSLSSLSSGGTYESSNYETARSTLPPIAPIKKQHIIKRAQTSPLTYLPESTQKLAAHLQTRPLKTKFRNKSEERVTTGRLTVVSRSPSPISRSVSPSSISTRSRSYTRNSSISTPRRIFPQEPSNVDLSEIGDKESSPVVFDANLSFIIGCKSQMRQNVKTTAAHMDQTTASNYLSTKISEFLNRTDHVMDEWKYLGHDTNTDLKSEEDRRRLGRSKSAANIAIKGYTMFSKDRSNSLSRARSNSLMRSRSNSTVRDFFTDDVFSECDELSEMTADLAEEHSTATLAAERLDAETSERIRLERELSEVQNKNKSLQQSSERLEMELLYARSDINGVISEEDEDGEGNGDNSVYKAKYERAIRELEFTRRRLQQQHEDDLEQLVGLKKQLEKKLSDAYEEVEEQRQVVGQWKRKVQKLTSEMNDLRLLIEEQNARNNLLEKKQRKFDSETQLLQDELRQEKQQRERISREKDLLLAEKYILDGTIADVRLELELKEERLNSLQQEYNDLTFGGKSEDEVATLRKQKQDAERRLHEQDEELDDLAGQVQMLEQAKVRLEMSIEQQRKESRREAQQRDDELEEVRCNAQKKVKALENQLENEHEERTLLLREKHSLERRLAEIAEAGRTEREGDEALLQRLKRDLRRTKALLRDAQTMLERTKADSPGKAVIRQLRNQLDDMECARAVAVKAKQSVETELSDVQSQLDEAHRQKNEAEDRANIANRERTDLRTQLEENEEELTEVLKKYRTSIQQLSQEQSALQEQVSLVADLEAERNSMKEQLAELTVKLESMETLGDPSSSAQAKRMELRVKDLESKLEFEQTQRGRLEVQITRLKEATDKLQTDLAQARAKEQLAQDNLRKLQRSLRELRDEHSSLNTRETESLQKRKEIEKKLEASEAETAAARADLRLALQRIDDLQAAIQGELEDTHSDHSDSDNDSYSSDESIDTFLANHKVGNNVASNGKSDRSSMHLDTSPRLNNDVRKQKSTSLTPSSPADSTFA